ncbi:ribonucleoside hydrolase RihC [Staphylococcus simiae]|uniref:ribonucleoside hydrolase RihC n=1 Tax=Staphylococcus simiae TaxID=308354 RepID=UPI001A96468B|nr:ribonucleoside hydrolase RihC [Staphylococcus simiae]MBO1198940.1 ribonucleoside hydrolase RihC [Staphylococcus simiae]MBO1201137.1 ribonucleoside hydrolase RihC [Staphylococcus simiae]MBO1203815.1 ribonucleoside hydrolase RihC [Staphylococcus simiae]MBO1210808.1 ribonucleoside hydrolase RihC [Staphylococcus simiae]MBO1229469.1 ribonucleoside hydrolase RihC [Staphylococcus simiae]
MSIPIIIDTDPGIDDAAAISLALSLNDFEVKMISTVNGNVNIDKTTTNALKLVEFFNTNTPVYRGASQPLVNNIVDASEVHGESGLAGYDFPNVDNNVISNQHAITAIKSTLENSIEPVTIVAIGPLTNIALLLTTYPEVKPLIKEIILMGGSASRGNITPLAEFNIYCDPEAANIVFNSELKLTMIGLDLAREASFDHSFIENFKHLNKTSDMLYHLFKHYRSEDFETQVNIYDVFTILYLLKPSYFKSYEALVKVELTGTFTRGATVVDFESKQANCIVVQSPIASLYKELFIQSLEQCI